MPIKMHLFITRNTSQTTQPTAPIPSSTPDSEAEAESEAELFDASESPPPYNVDEERRLLFSPSSPAEPSSAEHHHHYGASESPLSLSDGSTTMLVPSTSEQEDVELGGMPGDSEFTLAFQPPWPSLPPLLPIRVWL